ncbi:MAG TPA: ubiquinone/menaquinone biosynthesis methyltransferase [Acidimicrobiales bacterium]
MNRGGTDFLPQGAEKSRRVTAMFDAIAPTYDRMNRLMTFGLDRMWRRRTVAALGLPAGATVIDLACGTGDLCVELGRAELAAFGVDLSAGMLGAAHTLAPLLRGDVDRLPLGKASVDGATCGFALRNLVSLDAFLAELARIVRPGGRIALLEVAEPTNPALRFGHRFYFTEIVPRLGAALSDGAAYRYLPRSVAYLPPPESLVAMVAAAGFSDARRNLLSGGIVQLLVGTRS